MHLHLYTYIKNATQLRLRAFLEPRKYFIKQVLNSDFTITPTQYYPYPNLDHKIISISFHNSVFISVLCTPFHFYTKFKSKY